MTSGTSAVGVCSLLGTLCVLSCNCQSSVAQRPGQDLKARRGKIKIDPPNQTEDGVNESSGLLVAKDCEVTAGSAYWTTATDMDSVCFTTL